MKTNRKQTLTYLLDRLNELGEFETCSYSVVGKCCAVGHAICSTGIAPVELEKGLRGIQTKTVYCLWKEGGTINKALRDPGLTIDELAKMQGLNDDRQWGDLKDYIEELLEGED